MKVNRNRYEASMEHLHRIFADMSTAVNAVSSWRCPYKNVKDRCTAKFGCQNQIHSVGNLDLPVCAGSDNLDYRNAWETA